MKQLITLLLTLFGLSMAIAEARDTWVNGYTRSNGTYVQGYHRSSPDSNPWNNYSTQGNTNPYTGQTGTVNPYSSSYGRSYSNSSSPLGGYSGRRTILGN